MTRWSSPRTRSVATSAGWCAPNTSPRYLPLRSERWPESRSPNASMKMCFGADTGQLHFVRLATGRHESSHAVLRFLGRQRLVEAVGFFEQALDCRQLGGIHRRLGQGDGGRGKGGDAVGKTF